MLRGNADGVSSNPTQSVQQQLQQQILPQPTVQQQMLHQTGIQQPMLQQAGLPQMNIPPPGLVQPTLQQPIIPASSAPALQLPAIVPTVNLAQNPLPLGLPDFSRPPPNMVPGGALPFGVSPQIPQFTQPPPALNPMMFQQPPPMIPQVQVVQEAPIQLPANVPMGPWNAPAFGVAQPVLSQQQVVMRAKMDLYRRDLSKITSIDGLIKYCKLSCDFLHEDYLELFFVKYKGVFGGG